MEVAMVDAVLKSSIANSGSICIGLEEPTRNNYFICNQRLVLYSCLDSSQLVLNSPSIPEDLPYCFNSTLSDLLSIHSPLIPIVLSCRQPSVHILPQSL